MTIRDIERKIFGTRIQRKIFSTSIYCETPTPKDVLDEYIDVQLVVMSRWTEREIMRGDATGFTGILTPLDKAQPRRIFGKRIAYDDTLGPWEILVAGDVV